MTAWGAQTIKDDPQNCLLRVEANDSILAKFAYDGDGTRRKRLDANGVFHYVGGYELNNNFQGNTSQITKYYTATLGKVTRLIAFSKGGTLFYVGTDHLGGTIKVADATFAPLDQMRYFTFGQSRDAGTNLGTDHLFTSQIQDASIGLYWYKSRAYDPATGRFCAPDTVVPDASNPQALNRYSYNINNPLRYVDLTGHDYTNGTDIEPFTVGGSTDPTIGTISGVSWFAGSSAAGLAANNYLEQRYRLIAPRSNLNRPGTTVAMAMDMSAQNGRGAFVVRFDPPDRRTLYYHLNTNPELTGIPDPLPHIRSNWATVSGAGATARVLRAADRVAVPFAIASDSLELGAAYTADGNAIGQQTFRAAGSIAGGWAGAFAGAEAGAALGELVGGAIGGVGGLGIGAIPGAALGGIIGGVLGGVAGAVGGSIGGENLVGG